MQGNKAYSAGDISLALQYYKKIIHRGPGVWTNIGNCHFMQKDLPSAIIAWRKGQSTAPYELWQELEKKCENALHELGIKQENDWLSSVENYAQIIPPISVQILFLLLWYTFFFFLITKKRHRYFSSYLLASILALIFLGSLLLIHCYRNTFQKGIVVKEVMLKAGPHQQFDTIATVGQLEDLRLLESRKGWCKVVARDKTGWVSADSVEKL